MVVGPVLTNTEASAFALGVYTWTIRIGDYDPDTGEQDYVVGVMSGSLREVNAVVRSGEVEENPSIRSYWTDGAGETSGNGDEGYGAEDSVCEHLIETQWAGHTAIQVTLNVPDDTVSFSMGGAELCVFRDAGLSEDEGDFVEWRPFVSMMGPKTVAHLVHTAPSEAALFSSPVGRSKSLHEWQWGAFHSPSMEVRADGLTVAKTMEVGGDYHSIVADRGFVSGRHEWDLVVDSYNGNMCCGIAAGDADLGAWFPSATSNRLAWCSGGTLYDMGGNEMSVDGYGVGARLHFVLDLDEGFFELSKDGAVVHTARHVTSYNPPVVWFPFVSLDYANEGEQRLTLLEYLQVLFSLTVVALRPALERELAIDLNTD